MVGTALPVLLSRALLDLKDELERAGESSPTPPSLLLWSNLLRFVGDGGVEVRDIPRLARLSRRSVTASVNAYQRRGIVTVEGKVLRLTPAARAARDRRGELVGGLEMRWQARFGPSPVEAVRAALEALVAQIDVELPHYPAPYGAADWSVAGGSHVKAKDGPPRVPAHGQDWPVVLRDDRGAVSTLPLHALVSQALVAFTIDYEGAGRLSMHVGANLLRSVPDDGLPIAQVPPVFAVGGSGKSGLERHGVVTVAASPSEPATMLVHLTERGRQLRDDHEAVVAHVEERWHDLYGADVVKGLRTSLEAVAPGLVAGGAEHPMVVWVPGLGFDDVTPPPPSAS